MFAKAAFLSAIVAVVAGQGISVSGASSGCNDALNKVNSDSQLTTCTASLLKAGQSFSASGASSSSTQQALSSFCSTPACDESAVRSALTSIYAACSSELAGGSNKDVLAIYDVLYTMLPFNKALCSKSDTGGYCAVSSSGSSNIPTTDGSSMSAQQVLNNLGTTSPNVDTFSKTNLPFLFLTPDASSDTLCTSCARNIMSAYLDFETNLDYAPGFSSSALLSGQKPLYSAIQSKCGSDFLDGSLQAAGAISTGSNGASPRQVLSGAGSVAAVLASVFALAAF